MSQNEDLLKEIIKDQGYVNVTGHLRKRGGGTVAQRNNNPGNIRPLDGNDFISFDTPEAGYEALRNEITNKIKGRTRTGLGPNSSLYDFFNVWAPRGDGGNDPIVYAENVARRMGISASTKIGTLTDRVDDIANAIAIQEGYKSGDGGGSDSRNPIEMPATGADLLDDVLRDNGVILKPAEEQAQPTPSGPTFPSLKIADSTPTTKPQDTLAGQVATRLGVDPAKFNLLSEVVADQIRPPAQSQTQSTITTRPQSAPPPAAALKPGITVTFNDEIDPAEINNERALMAADNGIGNVEPNRNPTTGGLVDSRAQDIGKNKLQFQGGIANVTVPRGASQQQVLHNLLIQVGKKAGLSKLEAVDFALSKIQEYVTTGQARFKNLQTGEYVTDEEFAKQAATGGVSVRLDDITTPDIVNELRARQLKRPEVQNYLAEVDGLRESSAWGRSARRGLVSGLGSLYSTIGGASQFLTDPAKTNLSAAFVQKFDPDLYQQFIGRGSDQLKPLTEFFLDRADEQQRAYREGAKNTVPNVATDPRLQFALDATINNPLTGLGLINKVNDYGKFMPVTPADGETYGQAALRGTISGVAQVPAIVAATGLAGGNPIGGFALYESLQPSESALSKIGQATKGAATGALFHLFAPLGLTGQIPSQAGIGAGLAYLEGERNPKELFAAAASQAALTAGFGLMEIGSSKKSMRLRDLPETVKEALRRDPSFIELGLDKQREIQNAADDVKFREQSGADPSPEADQTVTSAYEQLRALEEARSNKLAWKDLSLTTKKEINRRIRLLRDALPEDMRAEMEKDRKQYLDAYKKLRRGLNNNDATQPDESPAPVAAPVVATEGRLGPYREYDNQGLIALVDKGEKPSAWMNGVLGEEQARGLEREAESRGLKVDVVKQWSEQNQLSYWDVFVARDTAQIQELRAAVESGDHTRIGKALGYSDADIATFQKRMNKLNPEVQPLADKYPGLIPKMEKLSIDSDGRVVEDGKLTNWRINRETGKLERVPKVQFENIPEASSEKAAQIVPLQKDVQVSTIPALTVSRVITPTVEKPSYETEVSSSVQSAVNEFKAALEEEKTANNEQTRAKIFFTHGNYERTRENSDRYFQEYRDAKARYKEAEQRRIGLAYKLHSLGVDFDSLDEDSIRFKSQEKQPASPTVSDTPPSASTFTPARRLPDGTIQQGDSHAFINNMTPEEWLKYLKRLADKDRTGSAYNDNGWMAKDGTFISLREMTASGGVEEAYQAKLNEPDALAQRIAERQAQGESGHVILDFAGLLDAAHDIYTKARDFADWSTRMMVKFGAHVRDYLADLWSAVTSTPLVRDAREIVNDPTSAYNIRPNERGILNLSDQGNEPVDNPMDATRDDSRPIPPDDYLNTDNLRRRGLPEDEIAILYRAQRKAIEQAGGKQTITRDEIRAEAAQIDPELAKLISDRPDNISLSAPAREAAEQRSVSLVNEIRTLQGELQRGPVDNETRDNIQSEIANREARLEKLRSIVYPSDSEAGRRLGALYWMARQTLDPGFWSEFARRRAERADTDTGGARFRDIEDKIIKMAQEGQKLQKEAEGLKSEIDATQQPQTAPLTDAQGGSAEAQSGLGQAAGVGSGSESPQTATAPATASKRLSRRERAEVIEMADARAKVEERQRRLRNIAETEGDPQKLIERERSQQDTLRDSLGKVLRQINGEEQVDLTPAKVRELNEEKVNLQKQLAENKRYLAQITRMIAEQKSVTEATSDKVTYQDRLEKAAQDEIARLQRQLDVATKQVSGELPLNLRQQGAKSWEGDPRVQAIRAELEIKQRELGVLRAKAREQTVQGVYRLRDLVQKELNQWTAKVEKVDKRYQIAREVFEEYQQANRQGQRAEGASATSVLNTRIAQAEGRVSGVAPSSPEILAKMEKYRDLQTRIQLIRNSLARQASNVENMYLSEKIAVLGKSWLLTGMLGAAKDVVGTSLFQPFEILNSMTASGLDILLGTREGERTIMRPGLEEMRAFGKGYIKAAVQWLHILRKGASPEQLQRMELPQELKVYTRSRTFNFFINEITPMLGVRMRAAGDNLSFTAAFEMRYMMAAKAQVRTEINQGRLPAGEFKTRLAELMMRPSETLSADSLFNTLYKEAQRQAEIATFHNQNIVTKQLMAARRVGRESTAGRAINFIMDQTIPFAKAVTNVMKLGLIDYSPIGLGAQLAKGAREKIAQQKIETNFSLLQRAIGEQLSLSERKDLAMKMSRGATGSVLMALGYAFGNVLNPPALTDKEYEIEARQGREPGMQGAFQLGGYSLDLQWLGVIGYPLMIGAMMRQADDAKTLTKRTAKFAATAPVLRGVNTAGNMLNSIGNPLEKGGELLGQQTRRYVPLSGFLSDVSKATDISLDGEQPRVVDRDPRTSSQEPYVRAQPLLSNVIAFGQQLEQGVPGARFDVPAQQPTPGQIRYRERQVRPLLEPPPWLYTTDRTRP